MILTETAPAALNPVPLDEFAAHLRLAQGFADAAGEEALLELYLRNAAAVVEARTGLALIARSYVLQAPGWDRSGHLVLPVGPVAAIDALVFRRGAETVAVDAGDYALAPGTARQRLTGPGDIELPVVPAGYVVEATFDAGFGASWNEVPGDLRQAVIMLAAHYFENRHGDAGEAQGLPGAVAALIAPRRPVRL